MTGLEFLARCHGNEPIVTPGFWGSVTCSCFHVFYFLVCFMLLVSCFPCPHVFMPLILLFMCHHVLIGCFSHVSWAYWFMVLSCGSQFYLFIGWFLSCDWYYLL